MSSEEFSVKWMGISIFIFALSEIVVKILFAVFTILTLGLGGLLGFIVKPLVYFLGGGITGFLSPGITLREPAIGAVLAVVLGSFFSRHSPGGLLGTIIMGVIAFIFALLGAKAGERLQGNQVD